ncbi:hypothetical protein BKA64DRAFT_648873 [Cadophora sp. MPI-SDFR-AT-0126]|nr:hypothetical protein BKA64DRAFT_648873 [Leotiomycetes sp. MPI-SDFR-AT-0126]
MQYERQVERIWLRLQDPDAPRPRHAITTRETFDDVCAAFMQAELGPDDDEEAYRSGGAPEDIFNEVKTYRAEWNIWAYYYGEQDPFPGIDPAPRNGQNSSHEPRRKDSYVSSYSIQNRNHRMTDIGAELRGRHVREKNRSDDQKERILRAIERRAEEAKKFMENRKRKSQERKDRKVNLLSREYNRDRDTKTTEWTESHVGEDHVYGETTKSYRCHNGERDGRYAENADGDLNMGVGSHRRGRSMSPTKDGTHREWRGGAYNAGYGENQQDWGYAASGRDDHEGQQEHEWSRQGGRSDYVGTSNYDQHQGRGGHTRGESGQERTDGSAYNDQDQQHSGFQPCVRIGGYNRGDRGRRETNVYRVDRRYPPVLRREDAGQLIEDDGTKRTSQWLQDSLMHDREEYRPGGYQREIPNSRVSEPQSRRDRGFGILKDAKECYNEVD